MTLHLQQEGFSINHKTVLRLMKCMHLQSIIRRKKYKSYKGEQGITAPNLLNRAFTAEAPHQKWATDVTEFRVAGQKLYLSPIIDLFNQEIISYEVTERPTFASVENMLRSAIAKRENNAPTLLHSDQGWQYRMNRYQNILQQGGMVQSMSRKGNCLDNAIIENFFGNLKSELYYTKKYESVNQLKEDIDEYIEYYNTKRIKLNLNGMSPIQYRAHYSKT
jgi:putative transposase